MTRQGKLNEALMLWYKSEYPEREISQKDLQEVLAHGREIKAAEVVGVEKVFSHQEQKAFMAANMYDIFDECHDSYTEAQWDRLMVKWGRVGTN